MDEPDLTKLVEAIDKLIIARINLLNERMHGRAYEYEQGQVEIAQDNLREELKGIASA